jgi:hypothetical protein
LRAVCGDTLPPFAAGSVRPPDFAVSKGEAVDPLRTRVLAELDEWAPRGLGRLCQLRVCRRGSARGRPLKTRAHG